MKRKNNILFGVAATVLTLAVISSCVMIMDSGEDGRSIIYLECLQGMSDTTAISVIATAPKFGYEDSRVLSDVNVTLRAGGRDIPLSNAEVATDMFPKGAFYTTERIEGGQTLEITVSGGGFEPVTATTFKPADLKPFDVKMEKTILYQDDATEGDRVIKVEITPDDPDIADHFYALSFDEKRYGDGGEVYYSNPSPILRTDGFIYASEFGDDLVVMTACSPWSLFDINYTYLSDRVVPVYFWRGASLMKDGTITVYFGERGYACEIRVHLMEVSPEFYRYVKTIDYSKDFTEALIPFVPSSYSYSNVKGGCGIFGAVSGFDGEWMKLPEWQ